MKIEEHNLIEPGFKKNFDFVDSIRCLAMIGIVLEHSIYNGTYIFDGFPPKHILYICLIQLSKFGTIAFFILAGFLLQFPIAIIREFPNIINIHPALLPKYGGKGMYGMNVHRAVLENKDLETGITIHYVNENYDEGAIVFQKTIAVQDCSSAEEVAEKIHKLEQEHFPQVIEKLLQNI